MANALSGRTRLSALIYSDRACSCHGKGSHPQARSPLCNLEVSKVGKKLSFEMFPFEICWDGGRKVKFKFHQKIRQKMGGRTRRSNHSSISISSIPAFLSVTISSNTSRHPSQRLADGSKEIWMYKRVYYSDQLFWNRAVIKQKAEMTRLAMCRDTETIKNTC